MGLLPATRNRTYVSGVTPVAGNDLNDLQDCIIGKKFPSTPIYIPANAFVADLGAPTRSQNVWTFQTNVDNIIVAPLVLWPGTRITNVIWSLNRNSTDASGVMFLALNRFAIGGASAFAELLGGQATGTGWTTHDMVALNDGFLPYTMLDAFYYQLQVRTTTVFSGAPKFDGVKLIIDRL